MNALLIWTISIIAGLIFAKLIQIQEPEYFISKKESTEWTSTDSMTTGTLILGFSIIAPFIAFILLIILLILSSGNVFRWLFSPKNFVTFDDDNENN